MIIGNLGRDPEMRYTPSGQAVTQFTSPSTATTKTSSGEWQKETEWFRVVVWGQQAERAAENLRKGNKVYIEGRIQTRQWEDQTGQKRYTTELVANQVDRTSSGATAASEEGRSPPRPPGRCAPRAPARRRPRPAQPAVGRAQFDDGDFDDLPF